MSAVEFQKPEHEAEGDAVGDGLTDVLAEEVRVHIKDDPLPPSGSRTP